MNEFEQWYGMLVRGAVVIQLLQLPFMVWLGKRMKFAQMLSGVGPLARAFILLFAQGIVLCVTVLGIVVALNVRELGTTRLGLDLTRFLAGFSVFRFERQLAIGRHWPQGESKTPHRLLLGVHCLIAVMYLGAWLLSELRAP